MGEIRFGTGYNICLADTGIQVDEEEEKRNTQKKGKEISQLIVPSQFIGDHLKSFNSSAKNEMGQNHRIHQSEQGTARFSYTQYTNTFLLTFSMVKNSKEFNGCCRRLLLNPKRRFW